MNVNRNHKDSEYLPLEESVKSIEKYCIEHDVLKEFLKKQGAEVINMLCQMAKKKHRRII